MVLMCTIFAAGGLSRAEGDYLAELQAGAARLELHERGYWWKLLHYEPRSAGSVISAAEDPTFFLAPEGRRDPRAELNATLAAFFEPEPPEGQHPQCRFADR